MRLLAVLMLALLAAPAGAATDAAFAQSLRAATRACLKASDLAKPAVVGTPLVLSDTSGQTAVLVAGRWKPRHMAGAKATMLCLYNRRTGATDLVEAKGWAAN